MDKSRIATKISPNQNFQTTNQSANKDKFKNTQSIIKLILEKSSKTNFQVVKRTPYFRNENFN
jgi:hypothetical protein